MTNGFFTTVFSQPLYNGLIFLMAFIPGADAGVAIVIFTVIVRLALYPLSKKSIVTQMKLKSVEQDIELIKSTVKDKAKQAAQIMAFYREKGLNPLSGFALIVVQIPIIFALYYIFLKSGLPVVNENLLYGFISAPEHINMNFLGLFDLAEKSYLLAAVCAISQFFQAKLALPPAKPKQANESFKDNLARSMNVQMKYFFPVMIFFIVYNLSSIIAVYWITNNLFAIAQEWSVRKKFAERGPSLNQ